MVGNKERRAESEPLYTDLREKVCAKLRSLKAIDQAQKVPDYIVAYFFKSLLDSPYSEVVEKIIDRLELNRNFLFRTTYEPATIDECIDQLMNFEPPKRFSSVELNFRHPISIEADYILKKIDSLRSCLTENDNLSDFDLKIEKSVLYTFFNSLICTKQPILRRVIDGEFRYVLDQNRDLKFYDYLDAKLFFERFKFWILRVLPEDCFLYDENKQVPPDSDFENAPIPEEITGFLDLVTSGVSEVINRGASQTGNLSQVYLQLVQRIGRLVAENETLRSEQETIVNNLQHEQAKNRNLASLNTQSAAKIAELKEMVTKLTNTNPKTREVSDNEILESPAFKGPLSLTGILAKEIVSLYSKRSGESDFERKLKRMILDRFHADRWNRDVSEMEKSGDYYAARRFERYITLRNQYAGRIIQEICLQLQSHPGYINDFWELTE